MSGRCDSPGGSERPLWARLRAAGSVYAEEELTAFQAAAGSEVELEAMVERRCAGEPVEHITLRAAFGDLVLHVAPGVFVPRSRTLLLARLAADRTPPQGRLLDLACGAGPVAAHVAARRPHVTLTACDADPAAAACARANLPPGATVLVGDYFDALPDQAAGTFDVVAANLPYVPDAALAMMPREARDHEPGRALNGGPDGLDPLRQVAPQVSRWLAGTGTFLVEVAAGQADEAARILTAHGLPGVRLHTDADLAAHVVEARPAA